jgi:hypothetical protein
MLDLKHLSSEELKQLFKEEESRIMEKVAALSGTHSYEFIVEFLAPLKKIHDEIELRKINEV